MKAEDSRFNGTSQQFWGYAVASCSFPIFKRRLAFVTSSTLRVCTIALAVWPLLINTVG